MKDGTFAIEAEAEVNHWWFVGRRRLFAREIARLDLPRHARVLDLGTSTGTNLRLLRDEGFTHVTGLDYSDEAIQWCATKKLGTVMKGDITRLPFRAGAADLVLATDVIEHVDDDAQALAEIARVLKPGAYAIITVPAFAMLWGFQDEVAHHKRRYRLRALASQVEAAGLDVRRAYYFNYLLFLPILAARQVLKIVRQQLRSENEINSPLVNRLLGWVFAADVATAPVLHPPFGVSAFILAVKRT